MLSLLPIGELLAKAPELGSSFNLVAYMHSIEHHRKHRFYQDIPKFSDEDYQRMAAGESVIINTAMKDSGLKRSVMGTILPSDIKQLWYWVNDRNHFELLFPNIQEAIILKRFDASVFTYQYLKLPLVTDRHYFNTATVNVKLNTNAYGQMYESYWQGEPDAKPLIEKYLNNGTISQTTRKQAEAAILVRKNIGAWLLIKLPKKHTLLEYYMFSDPEGSLPEFAINQASTSTLKKIANKFSKMTEKDFSDHFNGKHEKVFAPDGKLHSF